MEIYANKYIYIVEYIYRIQKGYCILKILLRCAVQRFAKCESGGEFVNFFNNTQTTFSWQNSK